MSRYGRTDAGWVREQTVDEWLLEADDMVQWLTYAFQQEYQKPVRDRIFTDPDYVDSIDELQILKREAEETVDTLVSFMTKDINVELINLTKGNNNGKNF